jgi:hypothetical protein
MARRSLRVSPLASVIIIVLALLGGAAFTGHNPFHKAGGGTSKDNAPREPGKHEVATAREQLTDLRVAQEGSEAGYDRDRFGQRWADTDHNGCDTRNDILSRDLDKVRKRGRCVVIGGVLHDPYTGKDLTFVKADAEKVQIDHVYPLALAWRMGADGWSEHKREELANDRDNLLATSGTANQEKSDSGPAEWKPRQAYRCLYAIKFVGAAHEYDLPVTRADHDALEDMLATC